MARIETSTNTNQSRYEDAARPATAFTAALAACLLLTACGGKFVKDQAPFVQVTAWHLEGTALQASLRLRNLNDEPLQVARLAFTTTVRNVPLASYDAARQAEVAANGFETLELALTATDEGAGLLAELQEGSYRSLPYSLDGSVETAGGRAFRFEREGHIYTVPGKPGHFR